MLFVIGILFKRVSIIFYKLSCAFVCACACAHERAQLCLINIFLPLILLGERARAIEMHEVKSTIATLDSVYKWLWFVIHINLHSLFLSLAFSLSLHLMNVWCLFSKMWTNNYGNNFDLKYKSRLINIEIEIPDEKSLVWPCTSSSSHSEHHYYSLFSIEMRISHLFHTLLLSVPFCVPLPLLLSFIFRSLAFESVYLFILFTTKRSTQYNKCVYMFVVYRHI